MPQTLTETKTAASCANVGPDVDPDLELPPFSSCPIHASLGTLGKKWALHVLRDVAFLKLDRFNQILRNNPEMSPRILSMRLRELTEEGLLDRQELPSDSNVPTVRYTLTEKGHDAVPILLSFIQYGIKHHADIVFADGQPRALDEVMPEEMLGLMPGARSDSLHV